MQERERQTKKELLLEVLRFLLVGGGVTVIDYLVFWLFDAYLMPLCFPQGGVFATIGLMISVALGFVVSLIYNWIFSVKFVYRHTREQVKIFSLKMFGRFLATSLVGLIISEVGMILLVWALPEITVFGSVSVLNMSWKKWIAKAIMICIVLIWNYLARKRWIFKA